MLTEIGCSCGQVTCLTYQLYGVNQNMKNINTFQSFHITAVIPHWQAVNQQVYSYMSSVLNFP